MISATIHNVKEIKLIDLHKQSDNCWVRDIEITNDEGTFELTMFATTKEALQVEVAETKKV